MFFDVDNNKCRKFIYQLILQPQFVFDENQSNLMLITFSPNWCLYSFHINGGFTQTKQKDPHMFCTTFNYDRVHVKYNAMKQDIDLKYGNYT